MESHMIKQKLLLMTRLLNQWILLLLKNRATTSTSFYWKFYSIKTFDDKYEVVELKNKTGDKQSILETQNEPLELVKEKEPKFEEGIAERIELSRQKSDEQPDTTDMPDLESEKSAAQRRNQQGEGLKMLTPNQMLSRLPVSLAQLNTQKNSEKLKNEIGQLLYSL